MIHLFIGLHILFAFFTGEFLIRQIIDSGFTVFEFLSNPWQLFLFLFFMSTGIIGWLAIQTAEILDGD